NSIRKGGRYIDASDVTKSLIVHTVAKLKLLLKKSFRVRKHTAYHLRHVKPLLLRLCWRMRLQVEKGMLWAKTLLVSSSVCKSLFIAVCPASIASVIRQHSLLSIEI